MVIVNIERVKESSKPLLRLLLDLLLHDLSAYEGGREPGDDGHFPYDYFDLYWTESDRVPYLIRADDSVAGFALVRLGTPHEMAEFFILKRWRRQNVGRMAALQIFNLHIGQWHVRELLDNDAATTFWRSAIPVDFDEFSNEHRTEQRFVISAYSTSTRARRN